MILKAAFELGVELNQDMQDILIYNWKMIINHEENPFCELYNKLFNLVN